MTLLTEIRTGTVNDNLVILFVENFRYKTVILTPQQAAELYRQLGSWLPDDLLNIDLDEK